MLVVCAALIVPRLTTTYDDSKETYALLSSSCGNLMSYNDRSVQHKGNRCSTNVYFRKFRDPVQNKGQESHAT